MTFGFSRDDIGGFLPDYLDKKILPVDPFQVIDRDSVVVLIRTGIERGRSTRPNLKVGICGEHGGEPSSVELLARFARGDPPGGRVVVRRPPPSPGRLLPTLRPPRLRPRAALSGVVCHLVGMDYVSCSPFRVPIARLAAAHAQIRYPRK